MTLRRWSAGFGLALVFTTTACDPQSSGGAAAGAPDAGTSPNASILPAPLATEAPDVFDAGVDAAGPVGMLADSAGRLIFPDAGAPPPEAMRPDIGLTPEAPGAKDLSGITLEGTWRWRDVPVAPKAPEVGHEGIKDAHKLTALGWKVDLSDSGRMRIEFTSRALPLPARAELRARADRYGTLVLWPNSTAYRVVAPGALRTLLGERRVDVTPLSSAAALPQGEGRRIGVATRKVELASTLGNVKLEVAKVTDAGEGGPLLCRALVEIMGIDPKVPVCQPGEVALAATYAWHGGGGIAFEVVSMSRRTDFESGAFLVPPPGARWTPNGLPEAPSGIFLSQAELAAFRTAAVQLPPRDDKGAPGEGFVAVNHGDVLLYLLLDGVPVVAVPAGSERYLIGPPRGRYVVQWRTFLGDKILPAHPVELPARIVTGATDAGAPDGG